LRFDLLFVVGGPEGALQRVAELRQKLGHARLQASALAGRHADRSRAVRLGEIIEVDPVAGRGALGHHALEEGDRRGQAPASLRAQHEDVEPRAFGTDGELQCLAGAGVARQVEGVTLDGGGRLDLCDAHLGRFQLPGRHGRLLPIRSYYRSLSQRRPAGAGRTLEHSAA
jgi:hypothetical protein